MSNVRSITPNDPANFTPEMGNYKTLQPFRYWCQKVLPLVYDDSLSYYELLCKVVDYLNKTMEDVETLHGDVTNLRTAYEKLQSYVNNYFSTLDVQEEINNKLDNMASSGELYEIIRRYTDPIVNEQNEKINVLKSRMDTFASLQNGSTTGDAELTDIRVGYNSIVYPSAGDAVREQVGELKNDLDSISTIVKGEKTKVVTISGTGSINRALTGLTDLISYGERIRITILNTSLTNDLKFVIYDGFNYKSVGFVTPNDVNGFVYDVPMFFSAFYVQDVTHTGDFSFDLYVEIDGISAEADILADEIKQEYSYLTTTKEVGSSSIINWIIDISEMNIIESDIVCISIESPQGEIENISIVVYSDGSYHKVTEMSTTKNGLFRVPKNCTSLVIQKKDYSVSYATSLKAFIRVNNKIDIINYLNDIYEENHIIYVGENEKYTKIQPAIIEAVKYENSTVIVKAGTYDIIQEFGGQEAFESQAEAIGIGIRLYNGIRLKFLAGSKVICNYTGTNATICNNFSVFNAVASESVKNRSYEIDGLVLEASGLRYAIHDECSSAPYEYIHLYKNCNISYDCKSSIWRTSRCIGGGLGEHGDIRIENCIFNTVKKTSEDFTTDVSYHNGSSSTCKSNISISCSYFSGNYIAYNYGTSENTTISLLSGNSFATTPVIQTLENGNNNMTIVSVNNTIRN